MKVHALTVLSIVTLLGCTRAVTDEDCVKIRDNMAAAWASEATGAMAPDASVPERAKNAIESEGQNLKTEWMAACQRMVGKKVDGSELRCMLSARTMAAINKCSEP